MRAAVFYVPEDDDPLLALGQAWLGRDARRGTPVRQPSLQLACITQAAARYGFHATLKPPMRLARGLAAFERDLGDLAASLYPVALPPLRVGRLGDALALLEARGCPPLRLLAEAVVAGLDPHRVPPDDAEIRRRHQVSLSALEEAMLARWGYPYVFGAWRFHITLTTALPQKILPAREQLALAHFGDSLSLPRMLGSLALCLEPEPGAPFVQAARFSLRAEP